MIESMFLHIKTITSKIFEGWTEHCAELSTDMGTGNRQP